MRRQQRRDIPRTQWLLYRRGPDPSHLHNKSVMMPSSPVPFRRRQVSYPTLLTAPRVLPFSPPRIPHQAASYTPHRRRSPASLYSARLVAAHSLLLFNVFPYTQVRFPVPALYVYHYSYCLQLDRTVSPPRAAHCLQYLSSTFMRTSTSTRTRHAVPTTPTQWALSHAYVTRSREIPNG